VPRLCELHPGICLTTEEKAWENLSKGSRRVPVGAMKIHKHKINIHRHKNKNTKITVLNRTKTIYTNGIKPEALGVRNPTCNSQSQQINCITNIRHWQCSVFCILHIKFAISFLIMFILSSKCRKRNVFATISTIR